MSARTGSASSRGSLASGGGNVPSTATRRYRRVSSGAQVDDTLFGSKTMPKAMLKNARTLQAGR
ncbi:hypothetical protein PINS_up012097 [Pythium insidiosum]|nr:hypothetical protein PINS_up012097 [Pythium insidiosum]